MCSCDVYTGMQLENAHISIQSLNVIQIRHCLRLISILYYIAFADDFIENVEQESYTSVSLGLFDNLKHIMNTKIANSSMYHTV